MEYVITTELVNRFNAKWKVADSGCFEWTAAKAGKGYGQIKIPGTRRQEYAHRLAYRIHHGDIPSDKEVCHRCDNPACVNPAHLWLGNRRENAQDMAQKGRSTFGERNHSAKLTEENVRKIKQMLKQGRSQTWIASLFGIHQITVSKISRGISWKHVTI